MMILMMNTTLTAVIEIMVITVITVLLRIGEVHTMTVFCLPGRLILRCSCVSSENLQYMLFDDMQLIMHHIHSVEQNLPHQMMIDAGLAGPCGIRYQLKCLSSLSVVVPGHSGFCSLIVCWDACAGHGMLSPFELLFCLYIRRRCRFSTCA